MGSASFIFIIVAIDRTCSRIMEDNESRARWTVGSKNFVLYNALISDGDEEDYKPPNLTACAMLLDAPIVALLPPNFLPPQPTPTPPTFYVADAGFKGAGMFAARDIPAGSLILCDRPIAVVPSEVSAPWKREAFDALIPRISLKSRALLLDLANCKPVSEHPVVEGIALTNAFGITLPVPPDASPQEYGGAFPNISRANHACGLNTAVKWDLQSFSVSMYALRDVRAGEEIFNQYIDVLAPREVRRAQLARYGFECTCRHCNLPDEAAVSRSDAARAELRDWRSLHPRYLPWSTDMCREDDVVIVSNLRALELIEQEGLHGMQVPFIEEIAMSYALLDDESNFRIWARKVVVLCAGQDPERAQKFSRWLENPKSFKQWGWRAKQRALLGKRSENDTEEADMSIPW
ncbi:unnamed protein product [Mycena citricolor]|uniref:SET domain-containing protein n=1 Tax=Mycena citricolor TaxID=2018698 RepID=A0AAD2K6I5_9AGAR|nr:unnamed protein product [Mycena citricolor]CAK5281890.1 unnamed protein product [Mycena citricolor]